MKPSQSPFHARVWGEIRDPIYGYIFISELEKDLIDSRPVQRLRYIKQIASAHLTYPGADHTRFIHSLGVLHLAKVLTDRLVAKGLMMEEEGCKVRIAALLHDVGHGPFSHLYEEILSKYTNKTHEDLTEALIRGTELSDILKKHGYRPREIARLTLGRGDGSDKLFLGQIVHSQVDVDKMDYLVRDSHFSGVEYGQVDIFRLLYSTEVMNGELKQDMASLYALEAFLIARYEMFKAVYYHKTVRSAGIMLVKAMDYAHDELSLTDLQPENYLTLDDYNVTTQLRNLKNRPEEELRLAGQFMMDLDERQLLKPVYEKILHMPDKFTMSLLEKESIRRGIEEEIAEKAGIDPGYVVIDSPTLPSLPYNPRQIDPFEISLFERTDGSVVERRLSEASSLANVLKGYLDVIRVYTLPQHRKRVGEVARRYFDERLLPTRVSY